jgi:hypothetical protein
MQSTGIIDCGGVCNAVIPPDSLCSNTLQVCENSCSSGIYYTNGSSFSMFDNDPARNLVACYTAQANCSDTDPLANVTASTLWTASNTPSDAVTLSGANPKAVSPNLLLGPGTRSEDVTAIYSPVLGINVNSTVQVSVTKFCASNCSASAASYCSNETFTTNDGCGLPETCTGTRLCDFNWKEVARKRAGRKSNMKAEEIPSAF